MSPEHLPRLYNVLSSEKFGEGLNDKVQGPDLRKRGWGMLGLARFHLSCIKMVSCHGFTPHDLSWPYVPGPRIFSCAIR